MSDNNQYCQFFWISRYHNSSSIIHLLYTHNITYKMCNCQYHWMLFYKGNLWCSNLPLQSRFIEKSSYVASMTIRLLMLTNDKNGNNCMQLTTKEIIAWGKFWYHPTLILRCTLSTPKTLWATTSSPKLVEYILQCWCGTHVLWPSSPYGWLLGPKIELLWILTSP